MQASLHLSVVVAALTINRKEAVFGNIVSCVTHVVMMARCEHFRSVCQKCVGMYGPGQ